MAETEDSKVSGKAGIEEKCGWDMSSNQETSVEAVTRPFNFLVRIPRVEEETIREQITLEKLHFDEKKKLRDAIQVQIQEKKADIQIHYVDYKHANGEDRRTRVLVNSKRLEIDSLRSMIDKANNALFVEEVNCQIHAMENMMQHETLSLKEEKQLTHEIRQLKQLHERLSSNLDSQDEINQVVLQKEEFEEHLKILKKERDILKHTVLQAKASAEVAETKYNEEYQKLKELQLRFRSADDVCRAAYAQWQNLRKELWEKKKRFLKYQDDVAAARNYAFSRNREALYRLCMNQVESFMKLWNTNNEFRQEYIKCSARDKIRPSYVHERVDRMVSTPAKSVSILQIPNLEIKQESTVEYVTPDSRLMKNTIKNTKCILENDLALISGRNVTEEVQEEVGLTEKEEETRIQVAVAKLKEELIKANEARERKKRQAEKVQIRAELKAQKEAEQKEKEREKRLRKKERKKVAVTDNGNAHNNCETTQSSEISTNFSKEMSSRIARKARRHWFFTKQSKTKSVPLPPALRTRNKKIHRQWIWAGFISLVMFTIFWFGDGNGDIALFSLNLNW